MNEFTSYVFHIALINAFKEFMNKEQQTSTLLARFTDDILKKDSKIQIKDLDHTMDIIVKLYG